MRRISSRDRDTAPSRRPETSQDVLSSRVLVAVTVSVLTVHLLGVFG